MKNEQMIMFEAGLYASVDAFFAWVLTVLPSNHWPFQVAFIWMLAGTVFIHIARTRREKR